MSAAVSDLGKGGDRLGKIAPVEVDRRSGKLPMAGRRVLAARGLDAEAPLSARLGERKARRRAAGRSLHRLAEPERFEARQPQGAAPQAVAVALAAGAGFRDMAERVGALIAVSLGVRCAAAADRIEDDENRAGHGAFPAPSTVLRTVPLPRFAGEDLPTAPSISSHAAQRRGRGTMRSMVVGARRPSLAFTGSRSRRASPHWRRRRRTEPGYSHSGARRTHPALHRSRPPCRAA